jgi:hypothetical protein
MPTSILEREQRADEAAVVYRRALAALKDAYIPFLVGGGYALEAHSDVRRYTKDLDIFVLPENVDRSLATLSQAGYRTEITFAHWLGKAFYDGHLIDIIFSSGNGACPVDRAWFEHSTEHAVLEEILPVCPAEEMIWQKAFILERDRCDQADIAHIIRKRGGTLDWQRLLDRFGPHWRVLLSHLVLFGFAYPSRREAVPPWVLTDLLGRLDHERHAPSPDERLCYGPLLSNTQYRVDTEQWGDGDARLAPIGSMTPEAIARWTDAFDIP